MGENKLRGANGFLTSCGVSALVLAGFGAAPALAQSEFQVDEVIVTAQKRAENLQEVPISVSTLTGAELGTILSSGQDVLAIAARVPGLYAESSNGRVAPRFYIRGLGNSDFDLAASQPVSVILDEVVLENVVLKSTPLFDVEQVEVLRGPQGTLFGRNTTAGIVKFDSVKPSQTFKAVGSANYGTYGTYNLEGGVGGPLINGKLAARVSALYQHRDDYIDNTYTGARDTGDDEYGGYDEAAGRLQLWFTPTDKLSALFNVHGRDLDGTSAVFRANILSTGSNSLNDNLDREEVTFDGGGGNEQKYTGWGSSLKVDYDFGSFTFTSITAYESADGTSRGDIDGGVAGVGPGTIPFSSDTQDSLDYLDQVTEEVRFASKTDGPFSWQFGGFYFDTEYAITTLGGSAPTTVVQENTSWAVFGQAGYKLTEALKLTGGLRYTDDEKTFYATQTVSGVVVNPTEVSDSQVSWDASASYALTPTINTYARVAYGFRGPSIQGRDVAFQYNFDPSNPTIDPQSVAESETVLSYEAGIKTELLDRRVRLNGAVFTYEVDDMQLTAIGGGSNSNRLLNVEKGEAYGFELDSEFLITPHFLVTAGFSYNKTEIKDADQTVGTCGSGQCTVTDPTNTAGQAFIDGNPFPNAPEITADFTARYGFPIGDAGELFAYTDWAVQGETNLFLYESAEFKTDTQFEGGLKLGYVRTDDSLEVALFARNITDEENIKGAIDFNNLTAFVNDPRIIGVSVRARMN